MRRDVPPPWDRWLIDAGMVNPRSSAEQPSMRQLAVHAEVATMTISGMVHGNRHTDPATVQRVAEVLGQDPREVSEVVGQARSVRAPYRVPSEVHLLSARQQAALTELIRAMAEESEGRGHQPAAIGARRRRINPADEGRGINKTTQRQRADTEGGGDG